MATANHPKTDSSGEAHVKICCDLLRCFVNENSDNWTDLLAAVEFAHNSTPNASGYSPFEVVYNRQPRTTATLLHEEAAKSFQPEHSTPGVKQKMSMARATLQKHQQIIREVQAYLHKERIKQIDTASNKRTRMLEFQPFYIGPFRVISRIPNTNTYRLELPSTWGPKINRNVNVKNLHSFPEDLGITDEAFIQSDGPLARLTPETENLGIFESTYTQAGQPYRIGC